MTISHNHRKGIYIMRVKFVDRYITDRIVISGNKIERLSYSVPIKCDYERDYEIKRDKEKNSENGKRSDNLARARQRVRRIVWANVTSHSKFLTLTSADTILDKKIFQRKLTTFFQAMKRKGFDLSYLYVLERQKERGAKENNSGCIHAHIIIFNDEFIPFEIINKCWKWGTTDIHMIDGLRKENGERVRDVGAYVCKYLTKEADLEWGSRAFNCSLNLQKPVDYPLKAYGDSEIGFLNDPDDPVFRITDAFMNSSHFYYNDSKIVSYEFNGEMIHQIIDYKQGTILLGEIKVDLT